MKTKENSNTKEKKEKKKEGDFFINFCQPLTMSKPLHDKSLKLQSFTSFASIEYLIPWTPQMFLMH